MAAASAGTASRMVRDMDTTPRQTRLHNQNGQYHLVPVFFISGLLLAALFLHALGLAEIGDRVFPAACGIPAADRTGSGAVGIAAHLDAAGVAVGLLLLGGAQAAAVFIGLGERRDIGGAALVGIGFLAQALAVFFWRFDPAGLLSRLASVACGCTSSAASLPAAARGLRAAGTWYWSCWLSGVKASVEPRSSTRCSAAVLSVP